MTTTGVNMSDLITVLSIRNQSALARIKRVTCGCLLVLGTTSANAALIETTAAGYDATCCESYYQARIGDNTIGGPEDNAVNQPWEIRERQDGVDTYSQRTYISGVGESFTLTQNTTLGLLTFTLGADVYEMDFAPNTGWKTIGIEIRVRDPAENPRLLTIDNLSFQSIGIADTVLDNQTLFVSNSGVPPRQTALFIQDDADRYLGDFTLSGTMTFEWSGEAAETGDLRFRIGVSEQVTGVPLPPAVWLFGSALGLLAGLRRKFTA